MIHWANPDHSELAVPPVSLLWGTGNGIRLQRLTHNDQFQRSNEIDLPFKYGIKCQVLFWPVRICCRGNNMKLLIGYI